MRSARHLLVLGALGAFATFAGSPVASAGEVPSAVLAKAQAQAYPGEAYSQWRRGYRGRPYYGRGYYGRRWHRGPSGGAVAAGVIGGLAAGALIGGLATQSAQPTYPGAPVGNVYGRDPNFVNYCASKYRSYDPASGTYLASNGYRYPCR